MSRVIYIIPLLLCFSSTVFGLKCYECDSSKNVACDFGFLSFTQNVKDCSADTSFIGGLIPSTCTKIVAKAKNGEEYIKRGCGVSTGIINNCQALAKTLQFAVADENIASIDCYPCDTDKCNSSTSLRAFSFLGIFIACLLYLL
ncbi:Sleepless protein [Popillia japonica]|uniref:Sleepless protein n=1 Tax=Popillia japonica TaxID=7064 RepID=A0AAW1NM18_POPJA